MHLFTIQVLCKNTVLERPNRNANFPLSILIGSANGIGCDAVSPEDKTSHPKSNIGPAMTGAEAPRAWRKRRDSIRSVSR